MHKTPKEPIRLLMVTNFLYYMGGSEKLTHTTRPCIEKNYTHTIYILPI